MTYSYAARLWSILLKGTVECRKSHFSPSFPFKGHSPSFFQPSQKFSTNWDYIMSLRDFPSGSVIKESTKESSCQCRRQRTRRFDSWEKSLEEEMATHSSILARNIPWTEDHRLQSRTQLIEWMLAQCHLMEL